MVDHYQKKMEIFGRNIWRKVQKAIDIAGVNNEVGIKECRLSELYAEIGKAYCMVHIADTETEFPELCAKAFALAEEIASLRASVMRIKGYRACNLCHATVDGDAAYCPRCGGHMSKYAEKPKPEHEQAEEADAVHCERCCAEAKDGETTAAQCERCGDETEDEHCACPDRDA